MARMMSTAFLVLATVAVAHIAAADTRSSASDATPRAAESSEHPATATGAPSARRPASAIPPCGPEVSAVLGGEDDTACLPDDIGRHGRATVPGGTGAPPRGKQPGR